MKEKIKKYWQKHGFIFVVIALFIAIFIILFTNLSPGRALTTNIYPDTGYFYFDLPEVKFFDLSPSRALTTNIYPDACSGEWFGADRVLGQANTLPESGVESFNSENSAFYRGGDAVIICEGLKSDFNEEKEKFISARLGIALAIDEIKIKELEEVTQPEETPVSGDESSDKKQQKIEENSIPPATTQPEETPVSGDESSDKKQQKIEENSIPPATTEEEETDNQVQPTEPKNQLKQQNEILPPPEQEPVSNPENQSQSENPEQKIDFLPKIKEKIAFYFNSIFNFINHYQIVISRLILVRQSWFFLPNPIALKVFSLLNLTGSVAEIEIETEGAATSTIAQDLLPPDAILNLRYLLEQNTYLLNTFSSYPISPATNNGYFYFDLPEVKSFADLEKIKISLERLLGGNPRLISYLDSSWIEITYEEAEEIVPPNLEMEKNSWRSDEEPVIKINSQPNHLIKADSFKNSLVEKLGIFPAEEKIELSLVDSGNQEIALELDKDFKIEEINDFSQIKLSRPRSFKPGHYKLKYKIKQNGENAEVEYGFEWGVLAINTNKSVYLSSDLSAEAQRAEAEALATPENAYLQMAVLSDAGRTICDANLKLEIINPKSETISFSTQDGTIEYSDSCGANNVTDDPDYFAYYQVGEAGNYQIKLINLDNGYEINDSFEAQDTLSFEVERISATRINPYAANYWMTIKIKANSDFSGEIKESVPDGFDILNQESGIRNQESNEFIIHDSLFTIQEQGDGSKALVWQNITLQKGDGIEIRYEYDAPNISPQLYLLGPLKITEGENIIFQETRQWQIAADTTNLLLFWDGGGGGNCDAPPAGWEVVNDGSFSEIFPRGNTAYASNAGGSATHTHSASSNSSPSINTKTSAVPGVALVPSNHTHTVSVSTVSTANSLPLYKDLCVIKLSGAGGIPSGPTAIPQNAIAIFDAVPPSGWSDYSSTFGTYYIRGNIIPDGTGGSNTHANPGHTVAGTLNSGVVPTLTASLAGGLGSADHSHTFSLNSTDIPSIEPLSQNVILGQKTTSDGPLPIGMIAMFDGDPGSGWDIKSDASDVFNTKYIKVTGTYGNNSSGAAQHSHAPVGGSSSSYTALVVTNSVVGTCIGTHSHLVSINLVAGTNTNLPPYSDVVIAKKLGFTVSGISDSSGTVKVAFDNSVQDESDTIGGGTWEITTANIPTTNQIITVWIDGADAADESTAVTKYDGSGDSTDMVLNRHVLSLGSIDNPSLTPTNLNQYDNDDDEDIMHDGDSGGVTGVLKVDDDDAYTNEKIDILANATLIIGTGKVLTTHDVAINGSLTSSGTGIFNIDGSWDNNNDFNTLGETINFLSTTTTETIDSSGASDADVNKVVLNGSGGQWTLTTALVINDDLTVTLGTLVGTQNLTVSGGDITGDGTITLTGGTTTLLGTGNFGGDTLWTFNALTFGPGIGSTTTTATGSGTIEADGLLTIAANQTLDAGSKTWNLDAVLATPFVLAGFLTPNASTFAYTGYNSGAPIVFITATTYNNLKVDDSIHSAMSYTLTGATSLNGDLTVTAGTLDVSLANYGLNVKGSWTTIAAFNARSGTVTFNGTLPGKEIKAGSSAFYNLTFNGTRGQWTLKTNNLDVNYDLNITAGTLIASTLNINVGRNLTIGASGFFTKGSGTFTFDGSGIGSVVMDWIDNNSSTKQDMGTVVVDGSNSYTLALGSSVKATKLTLGADDRLELGTGSYTLTLTGSGAGVLTITPGGILTIGISTVEYTGGAATDVIRLDPLTDQYYNLTLNGTGPFTAEAGPWTINNNLTVASGTFNLGGVTTITNDVSITAGSTTSTLDVVSGQNYALTVHGSWTNSGGVFNAQAGLVTFTAATSGKTITSNGSAFYQLTLNGTGGAWTLQDALDVNSSFDFTIGSLIQAANANINLGGDVALESAAVFTKASNSGLVIFDGTNNATFHDNTASKQNLGNVQVGTSPDDITLCTDMKMDSLTVKGGDVFYLNTFDIDVTNIIVVESTGKLDASFDRSSSCNAGGGIALINLETDWTVASDGAFLAGNSTVTFDGPASKGSTINSGGTDGNHDFYNFTMAKTPVVVGVGNSLAANLKVSNNFNISTPDSNLGTNNYNIRVGGNWSNAGVFTAGTGIVTFDAGSTGKIINSGGTGAAKDFYNVDFNSSAGGWIISGNDLTATNNFSIIDTSDAANSFVVLGGRTITVNGNFTNLQGGSATLWAGSTLNLTKTGGGFYTINTKIAGGDVYGTLQVGANTDPRMWNSSFTTSTVVSSGSLYSMDHATTNGELYIWGDYHTGYATTTDYWNYVEDFDGTAAANRQVKVYLQAAGATNPSVTVDGGSTLNVFGGGTTSTDITIVGQDASALWDFNCTGTCNVQESTWNYLNLTGGTLTVYNTTLNNEDAPDAGTLNVDWYLGDLVKDADGSFINTGDNDITISEHSASPTSTVFVWSGGGWSGGTTSTTTGTDTDGKIPQPGTNRAIKIREYARTSAGHTYYKYNLHITWQGSSYGEYDYYDDYGENYIISTLAGIAVHTDPCISELWQRNDIDLQNTPIQAVDEPPTNGTWYNQLISGLVFSIDDYSLEFSYLIPGGNPTSTVNALVVSCTASNGFVTYVWSTQAMTRSGGSETIIDWSGTNEFPSSWGNGSYGFGYNTNDEDLAGPGDPGRFAGNKFAGFVHLGPGDPVADETGPIANKTYNITYQIAAETTQKPGIYTTTIVYVIVPNY